MSEESSEELVEDAQIDGLKGHSRFGGFVRGLLMGGVLAGAGLLALTLSTPLPDHLPGVGTVEVVSARPSAGKAPAADVSGQEEAESETPQTDEDDTTAAAAPAPDAAGGDPVPEPPAAVLSDDAAAPADAAPAEDQAAAGQTSDEVSDEAVPDAAAPEEGGAEAPPADQETGETVVATAPTPTPEEEPEPVELPEPAPTLSLGGPALSVNARVFEAPAGAPLLAVVLEDVGNGTLSAEALGLMTMPLTLAVRPEGEGARALAEAARAAGHEILAQLPMVDSDGAVPVGALTQATPPEDLQALTTRYLAVLDMSVGATAPEGARMVNDPRAMEAVLAPVSAYGFAWLDLKAGIGSTPRRVAGTMGLSYAESNRFVGDGASEDQVYQMLEGAAFQARRQGSAVVAVSASQVALKALLRWGLERGGQEVWFAPLSAVIERQAGG